MKKYIYIMVVALAGSTWSMAGNEATTTTSTITESKEIKADSLQNPRMKALILQENNLKKQIQEADKKRNAVYNGVLPETAEALNDRQDSICLDLRSRLVSVQLEMAEIKEAALLQKLQEAKQATKK